MQLILLNIAYCIILVLNRLLCINYLEFPSELAIFPSGICLMCRHLKDGASISQQFSLGSSVATSSVPVAVAVGATSAAGRFSKLSFSQGNVVHRYIAY